MLPCRQEQRAQNESLFFIVHPTSPLTDGCHDRPSVLVACISLHCLLSKSFKVHLEQKNKLCFPLHAPHPIGSGNGGAGVLLAQWGMEAQNACSSGRMRWRRVRWTFAKLLSYTQENKVKFTKWLFINLLFIAIICPHIPNPGLLWDNSVLNHVSQPASKPAKRTGCKTRPHQKTLFHNGQFVKIVGNLLMSHRLHVINKTK